MHQSSAALSALLSPHTPPVRRVPAGDAAGLAAGTPVMTLDGLLPIEHLAPGDGVVTRAGVRRLRRLDVSDFTDSRACRVAASALGHGRPYGPVILGPETRVHLRDWRAPVLYGSASALVRVARLVDGAQITLDPTHDTLRLFAPVFDDVEIYFAGGIELAATG